MKAAIYVYGALFNFINFKYPQHYFILCSYPITQLHIIMLCKTRNKK